MFIENHFTQEYFAIIRLAQDRCPASMKRKQVREILGYAERHHIIPRSMGGSNQIDNLVWLTAREHLQCHMLLIEMLQGPGRRKMLSALTRMINKQNHNHQRDYDLPDDIDTIRRKCAEEHSSYMKNKHAGKGNPFFGRQHTDESKLRISLGGKGIKKTQEAKQKMSETKKGDLNPGRRIVTCPHCDKVGRSGGMRKHHFSHCKQKPS